MAKPKRTFSADVGQQSIGVAGPDQLEYDLDNLFAMLDPNDLLRDNSPGGINTENMRTDAVTDTILGNRTVDQAIVDVESNTGTLTQLLSWIVKHVKAVKGNVTNWYDAATTSLSALWDKFNATTGHKHTGAANDAPQIGTTGIADGAVILPKLDPALVTQVGINEHRRTTPIDHPDDSITDAKLSNASTDIKQRFASHSADNANPHQVKAEQVFALGGVPADTAFPTTPANYTLFYRADLKKLFIYLP